MLIIGIYKISNSHKEQLFDEKQVYKRNLQKIQAEDFLVVISLLRDNYKIHFPINFCSHLNQKNQFIL